jgi:putative SOS response-associated peptidase YedK
MCNAYKLGDTIVTARDIDELILEHLTYLPSWLIRRTGKGMVVIDDDGKLVPRVMRWGFPHPRYREVNNTRADSLHNPFWKESLKERRCLVPIQEFYEWEELPPAAPKGMTKPCYSFKRPDGRLLWVAGIWEEFPEIGQCYSTITRKPAPPVHPIHDRQLASLPWDRAVAFLAGEPMSWEPDGDGLVATPVPSPLKSKKPSQNPRGERKPAPRDESPPPIQGEFF